MFWKIRRPILEVLLAYIPVVQSLTYGGRRKRTAPRGSNKISPKSKDHRARAVEAFWSLLITRVRPFTPIGHRPRDTNALHSLVMR